LRFSNLLFENMWDRNSIDHIQISLNETVGLEGRAGFYDDAGALRDMVQNHLLQLLCLVAMEPPNQNNSANIRAEKLKVLRSLRLIAQSEIKQHTIRGQYVTGEAGGKLVPGYLEELDKPESFCETFVAIRAFVDNWRWKDVPFYLRTGKRLKQRVAEIVVQFKPITHSIYSQSAGEPVPNKLVIQLQPEEKIQLYLNSKDLGKSEVKLQPAVLDLNLTGNFKHFHSDAYKRLLLDVINDDASLFIHRDEVKSAWGWIDPIIESWKQENYEPELYRSGSWGPESSNDLLSEDGRKWHLATEENCNE
ncbi:MAG: glucose-6-phosphate dehydrogenase (NADP(+)), partial [Kangiellaceae bacterium]|nr:glucose-6-phosphate dehydrogenase (NADP(+)) [Kangiellaceae bacterium]